MFNVNEKYGSATGDPTEEKDAIANYRELLLGPDTVVKSLVLAVNEQECAAIAREIEKSGATAVCESNRIGALKKLRSTRFDVIFAESAIPGLNEDRFIASAKELCPDLEVFVIVPLEKVKESVGYLKKGVEGLLINLDLAGQLQVTVRKVRDRKQLKRLAYTDGLTSLFNHNVFQHFLLQECRRCARNRRSFALLILDIDEFKLYNDLNGHLLGDIALIKIAKLLKQHTRSSDIPARYGGDEFAIILTEIALDEAFLRASRICQTVSLSPFQHEKDLPNKKLTISVGLALYPEHGSGHLELLEHADKALYQAKTEGRNRVCVYKN